ncbi:hypothetical protein HanPI659440_Chr12g0480381 [Helianthus annuus]|uniref:RNA polymerase II degradation factor 1 isoform X1 n=1 Tax=Helianthus annuus TaxID=4232 RepID=UPI001652D122|nr:RNA polymerase II degradation factor 1 isoform X1 [Helianthus annuus]XP_035837040.1 RNA polymerase II degradation factor 1 isoform X1 [Helianthus annuus]KAJ0727318.1 hypothetical protein HanPI659440_Chr12g0480381 [Helianthus annuus]
MPERDVGNENIGYDPAIDYEMQLAASASRDKTSKQDKKGSKSSAEKHQLSKPNQGMVRKVRPSKVNNNNNNNKSTLEEEARADKLRSYKAELQKMKKEQQDAEQKRLEALKMERQKRIYARTTNSSKKQLPSPSSSTSKLSPISHMRGSTKFTDSEPGSSSPLQRSKIRPPINNSKKPSTNSGAGNRMTRSLSDTKKELTSVSKASSSMTCIRRLSEPRKINNTTSTPHTKTKSAESVSKPKPKPSNGSTETKKISEPSKVKVKVKPSVEETTSEVAKLNLNNRLSDAANDNSSPVVIDKTVVMLEEHNNQ